MKTKKWIVLGVVALIIVILISSIIGSYNGLVSKNETVDEKYAVIQSQLQRRADLVPNLVETVKGYAAHEKEVFAAVSDARAKLSAASNMKELSEAQENLTVALNNLLAVAEAYPELKANENFLNLQEQLEGTENRIAVARNDYNAAAKTYNSAIKKFPSVIIASIFGFDSVDYFRAEAGAETAPEVIF
ncbi:MAG: LemA family protein [bacterium]|nr:LemA family protein [bacterium]